MRRDRRKWYFSFLGRKHYFVVVVFFYSFGGKNYILDFQKDYYRNI